jgi:hypothetical protein
MQDKSETRLYILSLKYLEIDFVNKFLDVSKVEDKNNFTINDKLVKNSFFRRRVLYAPLKEKDLKIKERIFLELPSNLQE